MAGYVYLLGTHTFQWYKIGKSTTPEIRVKDLGILLPFKVEVFAVWKAEDHSMMEAALHEKYKENRINGEWFKFAPRRIKQIIDSIPTEARVFILSNFSNVERDCPEGHRIIVKVRNDVVQP